MQKLPHDSQAEEYLAAVALLEPEQALSACSPDDFHLDRFRWLMQAVAALSARGEPVDAITLSHQLERAGHLKEIGGVAELARLGSLGVIPSYARHYGRLVRESAARRALLLASTKIAGLAMDGNGKDSGAILAESKQMLEDLTRATAEARFTVYGTADIWADRPSLTYLTREIPLPSLILLYGAPGDFKSWTGQDLGVCVATGSAWLGTRPVTQGPVLVVDEENGHRRIVTRLRELLSARDVAPGREVPLHFITSAGLNILDLSDFAALSAIVARLGVKMILVDSLIDISGGVNENAAAEMAPVLLRLRQLSEKHGCTVVLLHHTAKRTDFQRETRDMARGSGAIVAAVDAALHISADPQTQRITYRWGKHRDGAGPAFCADFNSTGGKSWLSDAGAPEVDTARLSKAEDHVLAQLTTGPAWKTALEKGVDGAGISKSSIRKAIMRLSAENVIERVDGGGHGKPAQYALIELGQPGQKLVS